MRQGRGILFSHDKSIYCVYLFKIKRIRGFGRMISLMIMEDFTKKMEIFMKENGIRDNPMATENKYIMEMIYQKYPLILVIFHMVKDMEKVNFFGLIRVVI